MSGVSTGTAMVGVDMGVGVGASDVLVLDTNY